MEQVADHSGRRQFIGKMSLLMAGALCLPATKIFAGNKNHANQELYDLWSTFCTQHKANNYYSFNSKKMSPIAPVQGHRYEYGELVILNNEMIAQPIWIYWEGVNASRPSDLLIKLTTRNNIANSGATINRYELAVLNEYYTTSVNSELKKLSTLVKERNQMPIAIITLSENKGHLSLYSSLTSQYIKQNTYIV